MKPFAASRFLLGFGLALALFAGGSPAAGAEGRPARFLRGDVDGDYAIGIPDAFGLLEYLFRDSGEDLACEAAADWNDDEAVNIGDVLWNLFYLFAGGPPPEPPYPSCGEDPTTPGLPCDRHWLCGTGDLTNSLKMKLLYVPPGEFRMGSPLSERGRYDDEVPHRVILTCGFYMSETEVTQGQYLELMGENPGFFDGFREWETVKFDFGHDLSRAVDVSWFEAVEFCERLSAQENRKYRLPTEAEWEYACRAGTTTRFWFGDMLQCSDERDRYCPDAEPYFFDCFTHTNLNPWYCATLPVGLKEPNPWGLYGMSGWWGEWCRDWYGPYPAGTVVDPQGPRQGVDRVWRGHGAYSPGLNAARSARRMRTKPQVGWYWGFAFRVVLKIPSCNSYD